MSYTSGMGTTPMSWFRWRSVGLLVAVACSSTPARQVDPASIEVLPNATLRVDALAGEPSIVVGPGVTRRPLREDHDTPRSSFVLVDAENHAREGAYVTLGGQLTSEAANVVGELRPQSLWIPAGERRTFALVDAARVPRPEATSARIVVRGALVPTSPPPARVVDLHVFDDHGKAVAQARVVNDAPRPGKVVVIAAFHDGHGKPLTRPFEVHELRASDNRVVQFVGPPGSVTGTVFVGDVAY